MVTRWEYIYHCILLCSIRPCDINVGCKAEYYRDQSECHGTFPISPIYVIMTNANADFIGYVGCFVWLDPRDLWDSRYAVALDSRRLC